MVDQFASEYRRRVLAITLLTCVRLDCRMMVPHDDLRCSCRLVDRLKVRAQQRALWRWQPMAAQLDLVGEEKSPF